MKSKKCFIVTTIVQAIFLLLIVLDFLCIWMFANGVPYTYPFAILGNLFVLFCPVELFCFITNLVLEIKDLKVSCERRPIKIRIILTCIFFAFFCAIKIFLYHYGDVLAGVV